MEPLYCDTMDSGSCLEKKDGGEDCEDSVECLSGFCNSGTCAPLGGDRC